MARVSSDRVLEISDGKGKLRLTAPFIVFATMSYPDAPDRRLKFVETLSAKALIELKVPMPRKRAIQAAAVAAETEGVLDQAGKGGYGVAVAGDILLSITNLAAHSPEHASAARAIAIWCEDQALGKTHEAGYVAASPRAVKAAWSRFKRSPICAARSVYFKTKE